MHVDYREPPKPPGFASDHAKLLFWRQLGGLRISPLASRKAWIETRKMGFPPHAKVKSPTNFSLAVDLPKRLPPAIARAWDTEVRSRIGSLECALSSQKWVICLTRAADIEVSSLAQLPKSQ